MIGIYKITNPSGMIYIGQSWNIERRFSFYRRLDCKGQIILFNSLSKYGYENHTLDIIHTLSENSPQSDLDLWETFYWKQHIDLGFSMMNIREPGSHGKFTDESKKKMSDAKIGKSSWNKGLSIEESHKESLSKSLLGKSLSNDHKKAISKGLIGNQNTKGKTSPRKGVKLSEETKQKLRDHNLGKSLSDDAKEKCREASKLYWAKRRAEMITTEQSQS